ncbi:hypothetical protein BJY24_007579 [Nocardia transvalensis]|uniref:Uncharacterized protein n=1 Tax=Nocardia transvalensis TaxID=37333 RepID=A0A7W9PM86_9NOCA|nr:hypothetical protein [Nocardia transvalensis]
MALFAAQVLTQRDYQTRRPAVFGVDTEAAA